MARPWISVIAVLEAILQVRNRHVRLTYATIGKHFFRGSLCLFGKQTFLEHYARVRQLVPASNLLEYHISEGWEPLCNFLGQPIPKTPFPSGNETSSFRQKFQARHRQIVFEIVTKLAVMVGAVALCYFGLGNAKISHH